MLSWFHALPNIAVFALMFGIVGLPIIAAPHLLGRLRGPAHHPGIANGAWEAMKLIVAAASATLAFSLVQVQGNFRNAEELVAREARALGEADRQLVRFSRDHANVLRQRLAAYTASIIAEDWATPTGEGQPQAGRADAAFNALDEQARALADQSDQRELAALPGLLRTLDEADNARQARLAAASWSLPGLFWWTIFALMALLVALAAFLNRSAEQNMALIGIACGLSLMIALVIVIDGPFDGETAVQPTSIARVLAKMTRP